MAKLEMIATALSYTHGVKIISIRNVSAQTRTELRTMIEQAAPQMMAELADSETGWAYDRIIISAGYRLKNRFPSYQRVMEMPFEVGA